MNRVLATIECAAEPEQLMPATDAEQLAGLLKALADPVRLRLLRLVAESPDTTACACHLPTALGISQPTLSHHLKKLRDAGIVDSERKGLWAYYYVIPDSLQELSAWLT